MHVGTGVFFQNLDHALPDEAVYAHELAMADLGEPLGFDSVWSAEHHFTNYTMCPDPSQLLTWVAARTSRVRLGSMVMVLPWHDPVRVAESFSVLDHMSRGRAILGIGRGLARVEFEGFRTAMGESRQRFVEYAAAILRALETGYIESEGEFYRQPRTAIRPAPFRSFKGRVYASSVSPESSRIMATLGVGVIIIAQKPWDKTLADLDAYRTIYREVNAGAAAAPPGELHRRARGRGDRPRDVRALRGRLLRVDDGALRVRQRPPRRHPGLRVLRRAVPQHREARAREVHPLPGDLQVWGTPDQVVEQMIENNRRIGGAGVVGIFSYGGMPPALATANIRLFAEKVLPRLKAHDATSSEAA